MNKWKILSALLAAAALRAMAVEAVDLLPFKYTITNRPPRLKYTTSQPEVGRTPPQVLVNGKKAIVVPGGVSVYASTRSPFHVCTAPGTYMVTLAGEVTGKAGKINTTLNFNKKGKGNGSAGVKKSSFGANPGYFSNTTEFMVVPETVAVQYVFGFDASKDSQWKFTRMSLEYAPDRLDIKKFTPNLNTMPSRWKDAAQADAFYTTNNTAPAKTRTAVKFTYDDKNLYVGFIASEPQMDKIAAKVTKHNGPVWEDDCVEFFFYDPVSDVAKQFIVNSIGTRYDCELRQAQAGDPYKPRAWDGKWSAKSWKRKNAWEAVMIIPWETLGFKGIPEQAAAVNFGRERTVEREITQWNYFIGPFSEVSNYAQIDFSKNLLTRNRKIEKINYLPKRARKAFKTLLTDQKNDWSGWNWGSEFFLSSLAPEVKKKHTLDSIIPYQKQLLKAYGEASIAGPGLPRAMAKNTTKLTLADFMEANKKYGTKLPWDTRLNNGMARKAGAVPWVRSGRWIKVDPANPSSIKTAVKILENVVNSIKKQPELKKLTAFIHGIDEPTNAIASIYSKTRCPEFADVIDKYSEEVKKSTGFGKYGIPDQFGKPTKDIMFERIAFWRWWNNNWANYVKAVSKYAAENLSDYDYMLYNRNTCSGTDPIDAALCDGKFTVSCDPYPTSTRAYFGMGRALYHTGYSVKILRDLSPRANVSMYAQAFNYHQGVPSRADMREWVSQAMKNGIDKLQWYSGGSFIYKRPDFNGEAFNELLEISRFVKDLPRIKRPTETKTAIYHSDYDRWALHDRPLHAAYTVYSILGEHNGNWFRFVSNTGWNMDGIKLLYIPRMRFTDPALTAKLKKFVSNGGTAVILDPDFMLNNIDGSAAAERAEFIGAKLVKKSDPGARLMYGKKALPLSKLSHLDMLGVGSIYAYDFEKLPAGSKVIAKYLDGKPAIIERSFGKGKVIFSAVMPFGTSDAAITPQGWKDFFAAQAKNVGEKGDLDIWFFELPEVKDKYFKLQPLK